jgi:hypothetical protein
MAYHFHVMIDSNDLTCQQATKVFSIIVCNLNTPFILTFIRFYVLNIVRNAFRIGIFCGKPMRSLSITTAWSFQYYLT